MGIFCVFKVFNISLYSILGKSRVYVLLRFPKFRVHDIANWLDTELQIQLFHVEAHILTSYKTVQYFYFESTLSYICMANVFVKCLMHVCIKYEALCLWSLTIFLKLRVEISQLMRLSGRMGSMFKWPNEGRYLGTHTDRVVCFIRHIWYSNSRFSHYYRLHLVKWLPNQPIRQLQLHSSLWLSPDSAQMDVICVERNPL